MRDFWFAKAHTLCHSMSLLLQILQETCSSFCSYTQGTSHDVAEWGQMTNSSHSHTQTGHSTISTTFIMVLSCISSDLRLLSQLVWQWSEDQRLVQLRKQIDEGDLSLCLPVDIKTRLEKSENWSHPTASIFLMARTLSGSGLTQIIYYCRNNKPGLWEKSDNAAAHSDYSRSDFNASKKTSSQKSTETLHQTIFLL